MTKSSILALFPIIAALCNSAAARAAFSDDVVITAQSLDFGDVSSAAQQRARSILAEDGMIAISSVPGLAYAREQALVASANCVLTQGEEAAQITVDLADSSKRSSWAAFVEADSKREAVTPTEKCPGLSVKMEALRIAVDEASEFFVHLLDDAVRAKQFDKGLLTRADGGAYHTFEELVTKGKHLDHFHVYEKQGKANELALDLHTDQGLFIGIVPSIRVSAVGQVNKEEDSFMVEMQGNLVARVKLPRNGDVVLFMIGDGSNFINTRAHYGMRPVPHALNLATTPEKTVRAWFGRMFFAPKDALLGEDTIATFESIINTVVEARRLNMEFPSLGCSSNMGVPSVDRRILVDPTGHNCSSGTAWCWMGCRTTTGLECAEENVICQSANTGEIWVDCPTCHDPSARNVCPTSAPTPRNFSTATLAPTTVSGANVQQTAGMFIFSIVLAALGVITMGA